MKRRRPAHTILVSVCQHFAMALTAWEGPPLKWTPEDDARFERDAWNGKIYTGDHYSKTRMVDGQPRSILHHADLDREVHHTPGDYNGFCSSHLRAHANFEQMCSERIGPSQPPRLTMAQRDRIAERQRADEDKVRKRLKQRLEARYAAERLMMPRPRPGSREARKQREERDAMRPATERPSDEPYVRWQAQFGGGRAHTERLTGQYVHSLGDVGRIERTPAQRRLPGSSLLTSIKMRDYFSGSLRDYPSPRPSSARKRDGARRSQPGAGRGAAAGGSGSVRV